MTGSIYISIVVPIVAFIAMAFWLGLVFYADSHPTYGRRKSEESSGVSSAELSGAASQMRGDDLGELPPPAVAAGSAAAPGEHERIGDEALAGHAS